MWQTYFFTQDNLRLILEFKLYTGSTDIVELGTS